MGPAVPVLAAIIGMDRLGPGFAMANLLCAISLLAGPAIGGMFPYFTVTSANG